MLRLTGQDWVGVVPGHHPVSDGWHQFPREWHVADCIHFSWLVEAARERGPR